MTNVGTITLHIFSNGNGFFDLGENITPEQVEHFRQYWLTEGKNMPNDKLMFGGVKVRVVEHPMPFGKVHVA